MTRTFKYREATAAFAARIGAQYDPASEATAALRASLIAEETAETLTAMTKSDMVETADGLADLRYVVMGAANVYACDVPDKDGTPVCAPRVPTQEDALLFCVRVLPHAAKVAQYLAGCPSCAVMRGTNWLGTALFDLDKSIAYHAASLGYPLDELFWEVHRSNLTKAIAREGIGAAKYGPSGKGPGYQPPDIAGVLARAAERFK